MMSVQVVMFTHSPSVCKSHVNAHVWAVWRCVRISTRQSCAMAQNQNISFLVNEQTHLWKCWDEPWMRNTAGNPTQIITYKISTVLVHAFGHDVINSVFKGLGSIRFLKASYCSPRHLFVKKIQQKQWNITISNSCFLCEYIVKCDLFLWCAAEFAASLLQSSVSHDP